MLPQLVRAERAWSAWLFRVVPHARPLARREPPNAPLPQLRELKHASLHGERVDPSAPLAELREPLPPEKRFVDQVRETDQPL